MFKFAALFLALTVILSPCPLAKKTRAEAKPIVIKGYSGKFETMLTPQMRGLLDFDLNIELQANEEADLNMFTLEQQGFDVTQIDVDGKKVQHSFARGDIWLNNPKTLTKGTHTLRIVYKYLLYEDYPEKIMLEMFADGKSFHCFGGWFPIIKGYEFDKPVNFSLDIKVPSDYFVLGSWVPQQYRDKPKADGKYKFVKTFANPYNANLLGGSYDVSRSGDDNMKLWIYTPKGQPNDASYITQIGKLANDFYTDWFKTSGHGEVMIAGLNAFAGGIQTFDGGYSIDSLYLNRLNFTPDFLAREMARGWWGGLVTGDGEAEKRFFEDSMPEFSMVQFLEKNVLPTYFDPYYKTRLEVFWKSHFPGESALTDQKTAGNDFLVFSKAPLVAKSLMGFMGEEKFNKGIQAFIEKYNKAANPNVTKPTFADFKTQMDESFGKPIDDFWKIFFETGKVPVPIVEVEKSDAETMPVKEVMHLRNLEETEFPITYRIYKVDGKYEDYVFKGETADVNIEGGFAGLVNTSFESIIPKPGALAYTMGSGTIASTLAWMKPTIFCLNSDMMNRAQKWASLTGQKVQTNKVDIFPKTPIICVGAEAISYYGLKTMALLPMKTTQNQLVWLQDEVAGHFSMVLQFPCNENYMLPMIADNDDGDIPADLSWTGIFTSQENKMVLGFRNTEIDGFTPPRLQMVETGWAGDSQSINDCRQDLNLQNAIGYKVIYDGLDIEKLELGKTERKITRQASSQTIYLDLQKLASLSVEKSDRYLLQKCPQYFTYSGKSRNWQGPAGLKAPQSIEGDKIEISWGENVKYMYRLDGTGTTNWENGSSLLLTRLTADKHKLRIIFYGDGIMSPVKEFEFSSGAKPPSLVFESDKAQCKDGKIVIRGTTDKDVTLDPPGTVNTDGSFEIVIEAPGCPKSVTVKAKNRFGLETAKTVTVTTGKNIKITMKLGSKTATDESGTTYKLSVPPQKIKGMTYVPMRFIGERLGAEILWDNNLKKVTYILGSIKVEIIIGKTEATVNGKTVKMPGPPVVLSGNTLVPVRFVAEALGAKVTWVGETEQIIVEYP